MTAGPEPSALEKALEPVLLFLLSPLTIFVGAAVLLVLVGLFLSSQRRESERRSLERRVQRLTQPETRAKAADKKPEKTSGGDGASGGGSARKASRKDE